MDLNESLSDYIDGIRSLALAGAIPIGAVVLSTEELRVRALEELQKENLAVLTVNEDEHPDIVLRPLCEQLAEGHIAALDVKATNVDMKIVRALQDLAERRKIDMSLAGEHAMRYIDEFPHGAGVVLLLSEAQYRGNDFAGSIGSVFRAQ